MKTIKHNFLPSGVALSTPKWKMSTGQMGKTILVTLALTLTTLTTHAQNNLGVNQPNPTAKTHITNTENQNSLQVDDEANDATPFVVDSLGNVGVQTTMPTVSLDVNTTDAIGMPNGTTAQRPVVANTGDMRFNSTLNLMEYYNGTKWVSISIIPAGSMQPFGGVAGVTPTGWLTCDGSAVNRTAYADLYAVIGTNYGEGDGVTTFNLPDLRGRFLRGADNGAGNDPDATVRTASNIGGNAGDAVGSLQGDEIINHAHNASVNNVPYGYDTGSAYPGSMITNATNGNKNTGSTGGSETRPKNVNVNFIIKY